MSGACGWKEAQAHPWCQSSEHTPLCPSNNTQEFGVWVQVSSMTSFPALLCTTLLPTSQAKQAPFLHSLPQSWVCVCVRARARAVRDPMNATADRQQGGCVAINLDIGEAPEGVFLFPKQT